MASPFEDLLNQLATASYLREDDPAAVFSRSGMENFPLGDPDNQRLSEQAQAMETLLALLQRKGVKPPLPKDLKEFQEGRIGADWGNLLRGLFSEVYPELGVSERAQYVDPALRYQY